MADFGKIMQFIFGSMLALLVGLFVVGGICQLIF
jgi:hypothetical protein